MKQKMYKVKISHFFDDVIFPLFCVTFYADFVFCARVTEANKRKF